MEQLLSRTLDGLVTVGVFEIMGLDVFFLGDENDGDFFDSVGVSDAVVFFEMGAFVDVVEDGSDVG